MFEISKDPLQENLYHVIVNDFDNLELFILYSGSKNECDNLLDNLLFAKEKGFFKNLI
jgi:hypothetical protein